MGNGRAVMAYGVVANGTDGMGSGLGGGVCKKYVGPRRHRLTGATHPAPIPLEPAPEVIKNNIEKSEPANQKSSQNRDRQASQKSDRLATQNRDRQANQKWERQAAQNRDRQAPGEPE